MIDPKNITTYAQYNEDIIILALLHNIKKGFYVDVGANYPVVDSVTKLFYDRGWRGINIEPIKSLYNQLQEQRPGDVNLNCGVGETPGKATFREYAKLPGHSTFSLSQKSGEASKNYKDHELPITPLKDIFSRQKVGHIDFLKIDVEGFEYEAVAGNDWQKYRPSVVCIEANSKPKKDWRPILKQAGYKLFINDGLNEYYLAAEAEHLAKGFSERAVELDYHALKQHQWQSWQADSQELEHHVQVVKDQDALIKGLAARNEHLEAEVNNLGRLSLSNQSYTRRLKRVFIGLTIDWLRFKKRQR